jgi:Domain of unknown function (DUF4838)
MLAADIAVLADNSLAPNVLVVDLDSSTAPASPGETSAARDHGFAIVRNEKTIAIQASSERGLVHASAAMLGKLGARFDVGIAPSYPHIDAAMLDALDPFSFTPVFSRRAFVSDIMTWNYNFPDRLELHLRHDREFIPWMARRGINAFSYIRHAHDTRLKIDEIAPMLTECGIAAEYGGHVLQVLLPRDRFASNPEFFPADSDGNRAPRGNLCVSNNGALDLVRDGALRYVREHPENELLHIWGADVSRGAWCHCGRCAELSPQLQYIAVVNAVASTLAADSNAPPVAYLAYHDTLEPHRGLKPMPNVWFEWAPRERCYSHAIDDPACETNPCYLETLKRYLEIFDGRGHVFEYYADAILFGGLGFATPAIIARDLRAYRALGIISVSNLTFGAFSVMAYPVNLETFVRATGDPNFDADAALRDTAKGRHSSCSDQMASAYRAVARASKLVLDYGDVMRPFTLRAKAARKHQELKAAIAAFNEAIQASAQVTDSNILAGSERQLWRYSAAVLSGLANYLSALELDGEERRIRGEVAVAEVAASVEHIRAIDLETKGTWGAYDLEWLREIWLNSLRRGLDGDAKAEEML